MGFLSSHQGSWTGTNKFRLMPTDEPYADSATATVSVAAGGIVATIAYTWSHPETGAHDGLLVLGPDEEHGRVIALWGDSFHQSHAARAISGVAEESVVTLRSTYGGDWEWIITVDASDAETLRIRMDNVVPESAHPGVGAYWAMETELQRGA
jgi:hypothetical protein